MSAAGSTYGSGATRLKSANPGTARAMIQGESRRQLVLGHKLSRHPVGTEGPTSGRQLFQSAHNHKNWMKSTRQLRGSDARPSASLVNLLTINHSLKETAGAQASATARTRTMWVGAHAEPPGVARMAENNDAALKASELVSGDDFLSPRCSTQYKPTPGAASMPRSKDGPSSVPPTQGATANGSLEQRRQT